MLEQRLNLAYHYEYYYYFKPVATETPVATVTPVGPVHVRVGEPVNLECQASGEPRPSVSWHRLDSSRRTMLSSPLPMESNAVMQVLAHDFAASVCSLFKPAHWSLGRLPV